MAIFLLHSLLLFLNLSLSFSPYFFFLNFIYSFLSTFFFFIIVSYFFLSLSLFFLFPLFLPCLQSHSLLTQGSKRIKRGNYVVEKHSVTRLPLIVCKHLSRHYVKSLITLVLEWRQLLDDSIAN